MVLNLSGAISYFNGEEVTVEHLMGLVINLENGLVKASEPIDENLIYNYTIINAEKEGKEKEIAIGSLEILSEENLEELREFYGYYDCVGDDEDWEKFNDNDESNDYKINKNDDGDDEDERFKNRKRSWES